ncbi:hypothetical protein QAD02_022657 [Eretmocerus hayati]|uniref:Uncharacterized protein n=1 Tax=Eretmocerus hayati TaxID=131215 RepID=A0ACC2PV82_9HYME|nr:hypothetical protein QAD02_022657 [Eretmocerus hayati]
MDPLCFKYDLRKLYKMEGKECKPSLRYPQLFICEKCDKSYAVKGSLWRHKRYECGVEARFKCSYCSHRSRQKEHLKMHINHASSIFSPLREMNRFRKSKKIKLQVSEEWVNGNETELSEWAISQITTRSRPDAWNRNRSASIDQLIDEENKLEKIKMKTTQKPRAQREAYQQKPVQNGTGTPGTASSLNVSMTDEAIEIGARAVDSANPSTPREATQVISTQTTSNSNEVVDIKKLRTTEASYKTKTASSGLRNILPKITYPNLIYTPLETHAFRSTPIPSQKVQISRGPGGKLQVHGCRPGQSLVRMPDGNIVIFNGIQGMSPLSITQTTNVVTSQPTQKVQFFRGPDGSLQIRGLMPGQQLIQTPDGGIYVTNTLTTQQQPIN